MSVYFAIRLGFPSSRITTNNYSRSSLSRTSWDPIKKFELSVVPGNQSVTSHISRCAHKVLGRHMYDYPEVKTLSCRAVELILFVLG